MKNLVCYYSLEGNTEFIAKKIADKTESDLLKIKPVNEINNSGFKKYLIGGFQTIFKHRPELQDYYISDKRYDLLFIGTPVWAGSITPPIRSFLHSNSLKAKKIILFSTYKSSEGRAFTQMKSFLNEDSIVDEIGFSNVLKEKDKCIDKINQRIKV